MKADREKAGEGQNRTTGHDRSVRAKPREREVASSGSGKFNSPRGANQKFAEGEEQVKNYRRFPLGPPPLLRNRGQ